MAGLASLTLGLALYLAAEATLEFILVSPSAAAGFRLAVFRRDYHPCSRHDDLAYLAGEHGLGHRHTRRDQHVV